MIYSRIALRCLFLITLPLQVMAEPDNIQRTVWVNEAIIATYTYNYQDFMARQKEIAEYFTADGWIRYSKAMLDSKLPETVKNNAYNVSAVATMPPEIKALKDNQWQATMPVLVVYSNPSYKQKQTLNVMITFIEAPTGRGVRGFVITNLQADVAKPACQCAKGLSSNAIA